MLYSFRGGMNKTTTKIKRDKVTQKKERQNGIKLSIIDGYCMLEDLMAHKKVVGFSEKQIQHNLMVDTQHDYGIVLHISF